MSASLVKELREKTGAGIVDCMNAIKATNGDLDKAIAWLQEKGAAKAAKKSSAIAAEGVVAIVQNAHKVVLYEVNSQTDFVAANDQFKVLVDKIGSVLLKEKFTDIESANALKVDGKDLAALCVDATATIGEKIVLRRAVSIDLKANDVVGAYVHVNKRIAAVLITEGGTSETARNVAMHIASMNPQYLDESKVPANIVADHKAKIDEELASSPKPEAIKANIAKGMLKKKLSEITLIDQEFVMEKMPVSQYLTSHGAKATQMIRLEVGEGIEKVIACFADEVKAQMK